MVIIVHYLNNQLIMIPPINRFPVVPQLNFFYLFKPKRFNLQLSVAFKTHRFSIWAEMIQKKQEGIFRREMNSTLAFTLPTLLFSFTTSIQFFHLNILSDEGTAFTFHIPHTALSSWEFNAKMQLLTFMNADWCSTLSPFLWHKNQL